MQKLIKNRYRVETLIGQGGMGAVYQAYDRLAMHPIALKQVTVSQRTTLFQTHGGDSYNERVVLANEFRTLASLRHPNIISVLDYGFDNDRNPFFTMELLSDGVQIKDYLVDQSHDVQLDALIGILQALRYLHQRGILHRDLKPANILVSDHTPRLLDFGLAIDTHHADRDDLAGTLAYLAPEVLGGMAPSIESDLYAFGVVAYEVFAGEHPYPHETQSDLIEQVMMAMPQFTRGRLEDGIESVLLRLLSKNPEDRYHSALDTIRALCNAADYPLPPETIEIRDSFLVASTFVGREAELTILKNALYDASEYRGQAYLIGGESGVGKSRLMDELRALALVRGLTVLRGQAVTEAGMPHKIWRDILPELLLLTDITDDEASILAHFFPQISTLLEREITPSDLSESAVNARFPLLIINLIIEAAQKSPLMIMLEDLQWATDSIDLLKQVVAIIRQQPILIIGNYRSDETPQLSEQLSGMQSIMLERLGKQQIKQLSIAMLGEQGAAYSVVDLIQRESEGNAFFMVEVVRALADEVGQLSNIGLSTLPAQVFAGGIQRVIERRLSKLPEWALYPVQVSSFIGRQINTELLSRILPDLDIKRWLAVCDESAIFSASGEARQFTHDKIREHVIATMNDTQTAEINLHIAETIETLYSDNIDVYAARLTEYYHTAGVVEKEANYAARAAEYLRSFDPPLAYRMAQRALDLKAHTYHDNPQSEWARLNLLCGKTALMISEYDIARTVLDEALRNYEAIEDRLGIAYTQNIIGEWGFKTAKLEGAIDLLEKALPVLEEYEDWVEVGSAYMNLSVIHSRQGEREIAMPYFEKCLETMLRTGNEIEIAKAYNNYAIATEADGDTEKALELHNKALEIRRRIKHKNGIATSLQNMSFIEVDKGHIDKAIAMRLEALQLVRESGNRNGELHILNGLANLAYDQGNRDQAISYVQESSQIAQTINDDAMLHDVYKNLTNFYADDENKSQALEYAMLAFEHVRRIGFIPYKVTMLELFNRKVAGELAFITPEMRVRWLASTYPHRNAYHDFERIEEQMKQLQAMLPPNAFQQERERGEVTTLDATIDEILATKETDLI
ncbi:MAG: protein kinase domain-containing protein [Anaerolineae bacterium]